MSANDYYLNEHLAAEELNDIACAQVEESAKQRLADMPPPVLAEFFDDYGLAFTGSEMERMLRNLKDACRGKQYAIDAILTCVSEFEKRCLTECESIERDLLDRRL